MLLIIIAAITRKSHKHIHTQKKNNKSTSHSGCLWAFWIYGFDALVWRTRSGPAQNNPPCVHQCTLKHTHRPMTLRLVGIGIVVGSTACSTFNCRSTNTWKKIDAVHRHQSEQRTLVVWGSGSQRSGLRMVAQLHVLKDVDNLSRRSSTYVNPDCEQFYDIPPCVYLQDERSKRLTCCQFPGVNGHFCHSDCLSLSLTLVLTALCVQRTIIEPSIGWFQCWLIATARLWAGYRWWQRWVTMIHRLATTATSDVCIRQRR